MIWQSKWYIAYAPSKYYTAKYASSTFGMKIDKISPYIPDFKRGIDHFCIHAGRVLILLWYVRCSMTYACINAKLWIIMIMMIIVMMMMMMFFPRIIICLGGRGIIDGIEVRLYLINDINRYHNIDHNYQLPSSSSTTTIIIIHHLRLYSIIIHVIIRRYIHIYIHCCILKDWYHLAYKHTYCLFCILFTERLTQLSC